MLLNYGSLMLIVLITSYQIYQLFHKKDTLSRAAGTAVSSALAALSGAAASAVAAQTFEFDFILMMAVAAVFAIAAGVAGGKPFGWHAIANGAIAGLLGGMAGAVIGGLFFKSGTVVLVADVLFIATVYLVQRMIEGQAGKRSRSLKRPERKPAYAGTVMLLAGTLLFAGCILVQKDQIGLGQIGQPQSQKAALDEENDLQIAAIEVTASGFVPKNTEFTSGSMIKANFNVKPSAGTGLKLVSKELNFSMDLKPGDNTFLLNNPQPGTYQFMLGSKAVTGTFTVVKAHNP